MPTGSELMAGQAATEAGIAESNLAGGRARAMAGVVPQEAAAAGAQAELASTTAKRLSEYVGAAKAEDVVGMISGKTPLSKEEQAARLGQYAAEVRARGDPASLAVADGLDKMVQNILFGGSFEADKEGWLSWLFNLRPIGEPYKPNVTFTPAPTAPTGAGLMTGQTAPPTAAAPAAPPAGVPGGVPAGAGMLSAPVVVAGDADYNALPSGTVFVGPDGMKRRKP